MWARWWWTVRPGEEPYCVGRLYTGNTRPDKSWGEGFPPPPPWPGKKKLKKAKEILCHSAWYSDLILSSINLRACMHGHCQHSVSTSYCINLHYPNLKSNTISCWKTGQFTCLSHRQQPFSQNMHPFFKDLFSNLDVFYFPFKTVDF